MVETVSVSLHVCLFLFLHTNTQFFVCLFGFLRIKCLPLGIWDRTRYWGSRWLRHVTACKSSWPSGNANVKKVSSLLSYCLFTPNSCFWYVRVANWSMAPDSSFCYPNWCFCIQLCDTGAESLQNTLLPFSWFPVRFWLLGVLENKKGLIPSFPTPAPLVASSGLHVCSLFLKRASCQHHPSLLQLSNVYVHSHSSTWIQLMPVFNTCRFCLIVHFSEASALANVPSSESWVPVTWG